MKWLEKVRRLLAGDYPDAPNLTTVAPISSPKADEQDILTLVEHGYQLRDSGHLEDALAVFLSAHAKDPTSCVALNAIGLLYKALNRPQDALQQFRRALEINPRHLGSLCNAAAVLTDMGEPDAAIENCSRALEIEPGFEPALSVLALSLSAAGHHDEALTICDQLVSDNPGHIRLRRNRALTLQQLGRFDEALADFKRIVELAPEDHQARMSLALNALLCGDFADGWLFHEARWYTGAPDRHPLSGRVNQASWDGQTPLSGKTILLHAEQGYGDTIQFSRYCRMVKARGARVLLGVPAAIRPLFRDLEGVDELIPDQRELPAFDEHSSLMSLPLAFSTRLDSIPEIGAKLAASSDKLKIWKDRLGAARRMRVAISWKGNPSHADDAKRSIQLDQFRSFFDLPIEFISIQFGVTAAERLVLSNSPNVRDVSGEIRDFEDSAAVLECCDLIISVDSAPAHLAGAMDKPCWILIAQPPDWRWLLKRDDSPWYPSVRLYRQPRAGEWATALEKLRADLSTLSASWVHA